MLIASLPTQGDTSNNITLSQGKLEPVLFKLTARRVLTEAYAGIGKRVVFDSFPEQRSLVAANTGVTDGELIRIGGLQDKYPNLIQVPVLISKNEILAFSKYSNFEIEGWQSLKGYHVSFPFGLQLAELKTQGMNTESVTSIDQGLIKLNVGRSDFFIGTLGYQCSIRRLNLTDIKALNPPVDTVNMFHYLHIKHKELAGKLAKELVRMQESGEMESIQKQARKDFLDQCNNVNKSNE